MPGVSGLGGVFVKSQDPAALQAWYRDVLGVELQPWGGMILANDRTKDTFAVWSAHEASTKYFEPSKKDFMINLRCDEVDAFCETLKSRGANVLDRREDGELGTFRYVVDPDGTLLELWQPPAKTPG